MILGVTSSAMKPYFLCPKAKNSLQFLCNSGHRTETEQIANRRCLICSVCVTGGQSSGMLERTVYWAFKIFMWGLGMYAILLNYAAFKKRAESQ